MSHAFMLSICNDQPNEIFLFKNIYRVGLAGIAASDYGCLFRRFCGKGKVGAALPCMDKATKNFCFFSEFNLGFTAPRL